MATVIFYNFAKKKNSTALPTSATTQITLNTVIMKQPVEVSSPVLQIRFTNGLTARPNFNYCYIQEFSRYYFINKWTNDGPLWICSCSIDVLASFKTAIGSTSCYIMRASAAMDGNIPDTLYPMKENYTVDIKADENTYAITREEGWYVMNTVSSNGMVNSYVLNSDAFQTFTNQLFIKYSDGNIWSGIADGIKLSFMNPVKYISSVYWYDRYPGTIDPDNQIYSIPVGDFSIPVSGGTAVVYKEQLINNIMVNKTFNLHRHPKASARGAYLNSEPFTEYYLTGFWWGIMKLSSPALSTASSINVRINVDLLSGQGHLVVKTNTNVTLYEGYGSLGAEIPLIQNGINGQGLISSVAGFVDRQLSWASTLDMGEGSELGTGGLFSTLANGIMSAVPNQVMGNMTSVGSCLTASQILQLIAVHHDVTDDDNADYGRPLMTTRTINTLSGFIKTANAHVINEYATADELSEINNFLNGGFYYE